MRQAVGCSGLQQNTRPPRCTAEHGSTYQHCNVPSKATLIGDSGCSLAAAAPGGAGKPELAGWELGTSTGRVLKHWAHAGHAVPASSVGAKAEHISKSMAPKAVSQFLSQQTGTEASSCHHCRAKPAGPWHPQPPLTQHKPLLSAPGIPAGSTRSSAALSQIRPSESRGQQPHWGTSQRTFQSDAGGQEHCPSQGTRGQAQHTQGPLVLLLSCPWLSESSDARAAAPARRAPRCSPPLPHCGCFTSCQYLLLLVPPAPAAALAAPRAGKHPKQTTAQGTAAPTGRADKATRGSREGCCWGGHAPAPQSLCSTLAVLGQDTQLWHARTAWEL